MSSELTAALETIHQLKQHILQLEISEKSANQSFKVLQQKNALLETQLDDAKSALQSFKSRCKLISLSKIKYLFLFIRRLHSSVV